MGYGWNQAKRASNFVKHDVDFAEAAQFEWSTALVVADTRHSYGEVRLIAFGLIGSRVHVMAFTIRRCIWIISLRRANRKEAMIYASYY